MTLFGATGAVAADVVTVADPWVRPAPAHAATAVFLVLGSSADATLVSARSTVGEVALMRGKTRVAAIVLPAGQRVAMSERGAHLSLPRVNRRLALGERVTLTLTLRDAQGRVREIPVDAEVRHRSAIEDERREHHGQHAHARAGPSGS
jgi:copper(I)-binding protein